MSPYAQRLSLALIQARRDGFDGFAGWLESELRAELEASR